MEIKFNPKIDENTINSIKLEENKIELGKIYEEIINLLKYYCSVEEKYYTLLSIWAIGAININKFNTFPYLFINAMKGSGKTRLLKLMAKITGGDVLNSLTEAVLFRTTGTLAIDEFEGVSRKGNESLRELLNSAYKKGVKVKRMKKVKGILGEEQKVEEFEVFRPIIMANIWGMDEVLGDRCIKIVLDKSDNSNITKKMERFETDEIKLIWCRLCSVGCVFNEHTYIEKGWNDYISNKYPAQHTYTYTYTQPTLTYTNTQYLDFYNKIDESGLNGRILELSFPLLSTAYSLNEKIFEDILKVFEEMNLEKKEENITESYDVMLLDFISQEPETNNFITIKELTKNFREFLQTEKEWLSEEWVGRALKRLKLIKLKRRKSRGIEIVLNIEKSQEKIKMFK